MHNDDRYLWSADYINTDVSNCGFEFGKLRNPKPQNGATIVMNCTPELAQPQLQKWARCSTTVFPKIFMFREKLSEVSPVPEDYNITPPHEMPLQLVL
jgi:hypothetical protein